MQAIKHAKTTAATLMTLTIVALAGCRGKPVQPAAAVQTPVAPAPITHVEQVTVTHLSQEPAEPYAWGEIHWLMSGKIDADAKQTFGVVQIKPGSHNALHLHPNCEELLYVLSGNGETVVADKKVELRPGDLVRVPAGAWHQAFVTGREPMVAVISYSSPDRQVVNKGTAHE